MEAKESTNSSSISPELEKTEDPRAKNPSRDHKRTTVRFSDKEFERIQEEARVSGRTIPQLLKLSHFSRKTLKVLFDKTDTHFFCGEIRRVGNNMNQIARKVNSGALEEGCKEIGSVGKTLSEIRDLLLEAYGVR